MNYVKSVADIYNSVCDFAALNDTRLRVDR